MDLTEQKLLDALNSIIAILAQRGIRVDWDAIQYGVKIEASAGDKKTAAGVLYYSPKKSKYSWVTGKVKDKKTGTALESAVKQSISGKLNIAPSPSNNGTQFNKQSLPANEQSLKTWIGTDEAGKGDLFGPLVVAGFIADWKVVPDLVKMGVRDSKKLSSEKIEEIADKLQELYEDRISIIELEPFWYNQEYPKFKTSGGINGLLGWGHVAAIGELIRSDFNIDAAVIDKFGGFNRLQQSFEPGINYPRIILREKAEDNPAVAAGAILARNAYDRARIRMKDEIGFVPHAGSSSEAQNDLLKLNDSNSDQLHRFVKTHFAPVQKILK